MNKKPIIFTKNQKLLTFFVFFILLTIISTEVGFFANIYALIYQRFGLTESFGNIIVGWIIFGNYLVIGISTLFFGFFADKFDRMKVLVIGVMAWSILSFFCFLAQDIATFMILRMLIGVGQGALMPIGFSLLMDLIKFNSRSRLFAIIGILNIIGPGVGIVLRGSVDASSWQYIYLFVAIIGIGFTIGIYFMKEPERGTTEEHFQKLIEEGAAYSYRIKIGDLKNIKDRPTNFWLIINFIDTMIPGLILGWLLFYIMDTGLIDPDNFHISQLLGIWDVLLAVIFIFAGFLLGTIYFANLGDKKVNKDKTIRAKLATWCSIITIPFLVGAFFPGIGFLSIPCGILAGIGMFFEQGVGSNWYASIMDLNYPENRGTMIALATLVDTIGRGLGGLIGGYISIEFWFLAILIISIGNMLLWLPVLKYIGGDIKQINELMENRAQELKASKGTQ